ncbi:dicer [Paratrimastix pyriformis]|uniref:Dicer n=1 Tax=Paratrimastix pyriformis TaxID=342808 RepID=A0ABQ8UPE6_9EUKA|nr:dicer [Paratrimastix pyriformis]
MLIRYMIEDELARSVHPPSPSPSPSNPRRVVFIAPTVPLVQQQSAVIEKSLPYSCGCFYGDLGVDLWNEQEWRKRIASHQVLVMTPQTFLNLLQHALFSLAEVALLCFDECHHTREDHPYALIMAQHYFTLPPAQRPKIFGMSSSPSIKSKGIQDEIVKLERAMDARVLTTTFMHSLREHVAKPHEEIILYAPGLSPLPEGAPAVRVKLAPVNPNPNSKGGEEELTVPLSPRHALLLRLVSAFLAATSHGTTPHALPPDGLPSLDEPLFRRRPDANLCKKSPLLKTLLSLQVVVQEIGPWSIEALIHEIAHSVLLQPAPARGQEALADGEHPDIDLVLGDYGMIPPKVVAVFQDRERHRFQALREFLTAGGYQIPDRLAPPRAEEITPKVAQLIAYLNRRRHEVGNRFKGIVFARRRITVYCLNRLFLAHPRLARRFLSCFIVGHGVHEGNLVSPGPADPRLAPEMGAEGGEGAEMETEDIDWDTVSQSSAASGAAATAAFNPEAGMCARAQRQVVERFREARYRLLFSTSVVEEGLDVQACNTVVLFDPPLTLVGRLQARGRARQRDGSSFAEMTSYPERAAVQRRIQIWNASEERMRSLAMKQIVDSGGAEMKDESRLLPDFGLDADLAGITPPPTAILDAEHHYTTGRGALVSWQSAVALLHMYCAALRHDAYYQPRPEFRVESHNEPGRSLGMLLPPSLLRGDGGMATTSTWRFTGEPLFVCTVRMPPTTPLALRTFTSQDEGDDLPLSDGDDDGDGDDSGDDGTRDVSGVEGDRLPRRGKNSRFTVPHQPRIPRCLSNAPPQQPPPPPASRPAPRPASWVPYQALSPRAPGWRYMVHSYQARLVGTHVIGGVSAGTPEATVSAAATDAAPAGTRTARADRANHPVQVCRVLELAESDPARYPHSPVAPATKPSSDPGPSLRLSRPSFVMPLGLLLGHTLPPGVTEAPFVVHLTLAHAHTLGWISREEELQLTEAVWRGETAGAEGGRVATLQCDVWWESNGLVETTPLEMATLLSAHQALFGRYRPSGFVPPPANSPLYQSPSSCPASTAPVPAPAWDHLAAAGFPTPSAPRPAAGRHFLAVPLCPATDGTGHTEVDWPMVGRLLWECRTGGPGRGATEWKAGMIVRTVYNGALYICQGVDTTVTATSPFPEPAKGPTFRDYYRDTYQLTVQDLGAHLIKAVPFAGQTKRLPLLSYMAMAHPAHVEAEHSAWGSLLLGEEAPPQSPASQPRFVALLIPEFTEPYRQPGSILSARRYLGALVGRLEGLARACELAEMLSIRPDAPEPALAIFDVNARARAEPRAGGGERKGTMMHWRMVRDWILEATTSKRAHDVIDLEKFETLGDAFLCFATALHLYAKYPLKHPPVRTPSPHRTRAS